MILSVVVTLEHFKNVRNVLVHETAILPCRATVNTNIVWYYEQCCDDFEHGLHFCSTPVEISTGRQYQIRRNAAGDHSLMINGVTMNITGLYTCRNRETQAVIDSVLLNVMCKYNFMLFLM